MFKKLKALFIIEEEGPQSVSPAYNDQTSSGGTEEAAPVFPGTGSAKGEVTDKFLKVLLSSMDTNNLEGFDYLEFKQFLKSLGEVQMEEQTKFQSAFATAQTMGATVPVLVNSAEHYLELLEGEKQKFGEAVKKQRARLLEQRQAEIQKLEQAITDKEKQIEKLTGEIAAHKKRVESEKENMSKAENKIGKTTNDFTETYATLVSQIQSDIDKIKTYLS